MEEKLFEELKERYNNFLYGKCSFAAVYKVEQQIYFVLKQRVNNKEEIESEIKKITAQIEEAESDIQKEYNKKIGDPLTEELLDFLKFGGLVKGPKYYERALKLREKLEKEDKNLKIRKRAAYDFLTSKKGINPEEAIKIADLLLELGALYMGSFWMYEE